MTKTLTVAEFQAARDRGDIPLVTLLCYADEHDRCRGRVLAASDEFVPCVCGCHS